VSPHSYSKPFLSLRKHPLPGEFIPCLDCSRRPCDLGTTQGSVPGRGNHLRLHLALPCVGVPDPRPPSSPLSAGFIYPCPVVISIPWNHGVSDPPPLQGPSPRAPGRPSRPQRVRDGAELLRAEHPGGRPRGPHGSPRPPIQPRCAGRGRVGGRGWTEEQLMTN